jgi:signal transduction histidine kinase/CheY-like chemotaxis protein
MLLRPGPPRATTPGGFGYCSGALPSTLDRTQLRILVGGLAVVTLAVVATRVAAVPGQVRFFDNLHWTAGYGTSALLAWTGWRRSRHAAQRWFWLAAASYFVGQLLWDVQVATGWNPFPGPSDVFFISLGPLMAAGLALELRGMRAPALWAAGLDLLGLSAAALAYTLALYLPIRGGSTVLVTGTLVAYPVFLSTALGTGVVVLMARRWRATPSLLLLLAALLANVLLWGDWNLRTLESRLADGIALNYAFSYTSIALGVGAALWSPRELESPAHERVYYVASSMLPVLLALGAGVALEQGPALPPAVGPWVRGCSLLIVVTAVARQGLVLLEREERLAAERRARVLGEQYRAALGRQEQAQRLEALGTLAAGVAHDFNNLLMVILGHAELARRDPGESRAAWDAVVRACERGASVVQGMRSFGRDRGRAEPRLLVLEPAVQESLRLLRAMIPSSVAFETAIDGQTPPILADAAQVQQILMNLSGNAAHAIGERPGRIDIRTGRRRLVEGNPQGLPPGVYAEIVVSDTGKGMDEATRQRIFEPFFTTKSSEGTGMGLAIVHGIVSAAGGSVDCESAPGRGARFTILWPAADEVEREAPAPPAAARPPVELPRGAEILIVDDERDVTWALSRYLGRLGLRAVPCNDPLEALAQVRASPERFAAVVCDMSMPAMRGDGLCRELVRIRPGLPVILSSGTETELHADAGFAAVLVKPYALEELAQLLSRLLAVAPPQVEAHN